MCYGRARPTDDVDFVIVRDHETVLAANPAQMSRHRFDPSCTWKLYHGTGTDIDLWKDEHVDDILARSRVETLAGKSVRIVNPHDLIAMKLRADRPQDDYDISEVIKHTTIDDEVVRQRVTPEQFGRYLSIKHRIGR